MGFIRCDWYLNYVKNLAWLLALKFKLDLKKFDISIQLKSKPTFHHLYVVYDVNNKVSLERLKKYLYAGQSEQGKLLKELYLLDMKSKK